MQHYTKNNYDTDVAIYTYKVKAKPKGEKNGIILSSMRQYFRKKKDDGKEKPRKSK